MKYMEQFISALLELDKYNFKNARAIRHSFSNNIYSNSD